MTPGSWDRCWDSSGLSYSQVRLWCRFDGVFTVVGSISDLCIQTADVSAKGPLAVVQRRKKKI